MRRLIFFVMLAAKSTRAGRSLGNPVRTKTCGLKKIFTMRVTWGRDSNFGHWTQHQSLDFSIPEVFDVIHDGHEFERGLQRASVHVRLGGRTPVDICRKSRGRTSANSVRVKLSREKQSGKQTESRKMMTKRFLPRNRSTWLYVVNVTKQRKDHNEGDQGSYPVDNKHDGQTEQSSQQGNPHGVVLEGRSPPCGEKTCKNENICLTQFTVSDDFWIQKGIIFRGATVNSTLIHISFLTRWFGQRCVKAGVVDECIGHQKEVGYQRRNGVQLA